MFFVSKLRVESSTRNTNYCKSVHFEDQLL